MSIDRVSNERFVTPSGSLVFKPHPKRKTKDSQTVSILLRIYFLQICVYNMFNFFSKNCFSNLKFQTKFAEIFGQNFLYRKKKIFANLYKFLQVSTSSFKKHRKLLKNVIFRNLFKKAFRNLQFSRFFAENMDFCFLNVFVYFVF